MSRLIGYSGEERRREGCPDMGGGGGGGRWQHSECLDLGWGGGGEEKGGQRGLLRFRFESDLGWGVAGGKGQDV